MPESSRKRERMKIFKRIALTTKVIFHPTYTDTGMCKREGSVCSLDHSSDI